MFATLRVLPLVLLTLAFSLTAQAATWDALLPLMTDLPGFTAEIAEGMDMTQNNSSMITVNRSYTGGNQSVDATLMAGTHAMAQVQPVMEMETSDYRIMVEKVEGFEVRRYFDKKENGGALFVVLAPGAEKGAVLIIGYKGMDDTEAMKTARRFDWKEMRKQSQKLLK